MLHNKVNIINGSGHVAYKTKHTTYQIPYVTHKYALNMNKIKHMISMKGISLMMCQIAHTVDGFEHGRKISDAT